MAIFVIFNAANPQSIAAALQREYPNDHLTVAEGQWLVSATGVAKDISDKLGITDGTVSSAIIFSMANYFGRASTDIWDWIKVNAEKTSG